MWCDCDEYVEVNKILYWFGALASPENHNHTAVGRKKKEENGKVIRISINCYFLSVEGFEGEQNDRQKRYFAVCG